ncbi:hypothetical protein F441_05908 [Phytophthora nicotianae CJ01A1]|uniref:Uncharacterized protein n=3 Tax=Phytophthora nicotianae TaxID=4792 RepID=W2RBE3_PHYN3|nr:hypothetical protein PPTG_02072 [Phytophthora nicotianae INRA-310]ETK90456.1 hypothetical protein L915_05784 [Phytophthora nicotianae]ETL43867.1 hypothetical protein L916_05722 [Phytophthora nicotianae]ETN22014.1 hypothetical protein PPTG_02072 [Phytophthora nicotianae INRA-310]ETP20355.1 hypothetical protein F441_05908 [Phytophthora nicotianae CJ01A1]
MRFAISIAIDGAGISKIGLHDLCSNIAIIPQDIVLSLGAVRSDLDPFGQFLDEANVCKARAAVEGDYLAARFHGLKDSNFSVSERQLVSIARALLKRSSGSNR